MKNKKYCAIFIVRHAQSEANAAQILGGNFPLTKLGVNQAQKLNATLRDIDFSKIYSSDLIRSIQTAEIVANERKMAVSAMQVLRERSFGELDGRLISEISKEIDDWAAEMSQLNKDERFNYHNESGIENDASLIGRYFTFLREVAIANVGKNVLIISHSNVMRTLLVHLGFANLEDLRRGSIENTGYITLRGDGIDFFVDETVGIHPNMLQ